MPRSRTPPADHAAARGARRRARRLAFVLFAIVFFRLWFLQVLTGDDYVVQARENRVRKVKIEAPRGNIVDRDGRTLVKTRAAPVVQILPNSAARGRAEPPTTYRKALAAAEGRRLAAADQPARARAPARADGAARRGASARGARGCARRAAPTRCRSRRSRPASASCARSTAGSASDRRPPRDDPPARDRGHRRPAVSNVTIKTDVPRRRSTTCSSTARSSPASSVEKKYLRHYPHDELGAQLFGTLREISPEELGTRALPRRRAGHADRQGRDRGELRQLPARHRRLHARDRQRVRQPRRHARARRARDPIQGRQLRLTLDLGLQRAANDAVARAIAPPQATATRPKPAPSWRWTRATARCSRSAPTRASTRTCSPSRSTRRPTTSSTRGERRAAVQPRDRGRLSDRLDVQADHRAGGARGGHHHAEHADPDDRRVPLRRPRVQERGDAVYGTLDAAARAAGLLRRLLLPARRGAPTSAGR